MQRNKDLIIDKAGAANAVRTVYTIAKALSLSRPEVDAMFELDVYTKVQNEVDRPVLIAYSKGLADAYLTVMLTEHCEFMYRDEDGTLFSIERVKRNMLSRSAMTCAHVWKDSQIPFTPWVESIEAGL